MNDCLAGFSNALLTPRIAASAAISQTRTSPVTVRSPRTSAWSPIALWSPIMIRRLSPRSARTPPYGVSSSTGSVWSAMTAPSAVLECVRVRTSQAWAVICIQVPISEIAWPP
jgi:hypothetical protein